MNSIVNFSLANKLAEKKKYLESIKIYKKLLINNPNFSFYAENAAYSAEKAALFSESAAFYLQAYLSDHTKKYCLLRSAALKQRNSCSDDLVLVIIPAFNAELTVVDSVKSVLNQDHKNIKVVVVDDASTDKTYEKLLELQCEDKRLYIIKNPTNRGPFFSVNLGIFVFRWFDFNFFIKHDADDLMDSSKLRKQIAILRKNPGTYFSTTGYHRIDFESKEIIAGKKRGHNMTLYRTDVFRKLGYFDDTRFGGDSEYLERAILAYGQDSEIHINERLTNAYAMEHSLVFNNPLGSDLRVSYQKKFSSEHSEMVKNKYYFRDFECREELLKILRQNKPVICGVATLLNRKDALRETVISILPQVDKLIVYQNDYKEIFDFLKHEKIEVISALDTGIDMGDAGKFYRIRDFGDVNYFSVDDDLIYPPNYVITLLDFLARYDYKVIVSAHGRISTPEVNSYYQDKLKVFHFGNEIDGLQEAHFGGTGVMAFNTQHVKISFADFKQPNMADVWMGLYAKENNIPILIVPHAANWISHSDKFDVNTTIFRSSVNEKSAMSKTQEVTNNLMRGEDFSLINTVDSNNGKNRLSKVINVAKNKCFVASERQIVVAIPTFNRKDFIVRLVQQLDLAAKYFNVLVFIFDDGSSTPVEKYFFNPKNLLDVKVYRYENHGKKKYWSLVNKILDRLSSITADYYFYLGDDLEVGPNFFSDAIFQWESIADEKKISLNLLRDQRTQSWTNFERIEKKFAGFSVFQTQWLDMIMMFDKKLVSHRLDAIPLSRWDKNPLLSSGVGAQLSSRFHSMGYGMYQVKSSLVFHGDHDSQMNPEERKINPLLAS